jgi:hypothetical protein
MAGKTKLMAGHRWLRKFFLAAGAALGGIAPAAQAPSELHHDRLALEARVNVVREALREAGREDHLSPLAVVAQWYNWPNWNNWVNWPNWGNWANWFNR